MLYGISSNTWLKTVILYTLEEHTDFISSRDLALTIDECSQSTIKKLCRELQEDIDTAYPNDLMTLIIDQRNGMKLIHKPYVNFQNLLAMIFSKEIAYELLQQLLLHRTILTADFCDTYFVSESQLRRKIETMNDSLAKHDITISLSKNITLLGEEHRLRAFFSSFLFSIHRQFSHIAWIESKDDYRQTAEIVAQALSLKTDSQTSEILAIACFITMDAIEKHWTLFFNEKEQKLLDSLVWPTCPSELSDWRKDDWQFLVLMIYTSDIIDLHLQMNLQELEKLTSLGDAAIWIDLFEQEFLPLTDIQEEIVYKKFVKQVLAYSFFKSDEVFLTNFSEKDVGDLKKDYPVFFYKYDELWLRFLQEASEPAVYTYFQTKSLMLCFYLVPKEIYFPQIKLFMRSDLDFLNTKHLEFRVNTRFCDKYALKFVADIHQADIILSTVSFEGMDRYLSTFNNLVPIILINSKLSENDFSKIETELVRITQNSLDNI